MSTENKDENTTSVEDKLKAAVAASTTGTEEKSTEGAGTEEGVVEGKSAEKSTEKSDVRIPKERFDQVNEKFKEAAASQDLLTLQLAEANDKLLKAHELLELRDDDVQTLNEIKSFVNDPAMKEHVVAIDNKLKGIEQAVEKGESTPDEAHAKTRELIEQTRTEMADIQNTAEAEALVARADIISDKLLAQLPDTYTDQDRNIVQKLWTESMDWEQATQNPDDLAEQLTGDFQKALDEYGVPRGALFTVDEVTELKPEAATTAKTPEQELEEVLDQGWGELKTEDLGDGKTKVVAVKTDDEFKAAIASTIRKIHGR